MKYTRSFLFLALLVMVSLACGLFSGTGSTGVGESSSSPGDTGNTGGGDAPASPTAPASTESGPATSGNYDTEFPLPADVQNFMTMGDSGINYQTSMKIPEVVDFYRDAFAKAGYDERDITTFIDDATFSIVWDGHPSGQAVVVQGVDLGNGTTNVNVRLEDV